MVFFLPFCLLAEKVVDEKAQTNFVVWVKEGRSIPVTPT